MTAVSDNQKNLFVDIWDSFRSFPTWVQVWIICILTPVNMISLFFLDEPSGVIVAALAIAAFVPSMIAVFVQRGFSSIVAASHIIPWTLLILFLLFARPQGTENYNFYLWVLLAINAISLVFDVPDTVRWLKGDRKTSRR